MACVHNCLAVLRKINGHDMTDNVDNEMDHLLAAYS